MKSALPQVSHAWIGLQPWVHFVPLRSDLTDLEERLLWCRDNDTAAFRIALALQRCVSPHLSQRAMEVACARTLLALPPPLPKLDFELAMLWMWRTRRCAVYVLIVDGEIVEFRPFANASFRNAWRELETRDARRAEVRRFLENSEALWPGSSKAVLADRRAWWSNGALVCNVMSFDVWGEAMLIEFEAMLTGAGKLEER